MLICCVRLNVTLDCGSTNFSLPTDEVRASSIVSLSHHTSSSRIWSHGMMFPMRNHMTRGKLNCLVSKVVCGTIDDSQEPEMNFFFSLFSVKPNLFCQDSFNVFFFCVVTNATSIKQLNGRLTKWKLFVKFFFWLVYEQFR